MSLRTEAEQTEDLMWKLLELERDLAIAGIRNETDTDENQNKLVAYQAFSNRILGSVREDMRR